ncbi:Ribosomal RNA small subunit methyltransferase H [Thermodesulfobium narugense DSM 14796]|uniref:Ribosomal RNA small subunit methyltransferase H n=1 Tax=Thermodesulfobium narugense DSM 14796 TaxID=747365 RepID=M1E4M0_9BACT|nr:16S rRNA (cytosine(1402)-N(4))-methyltransferase RsmH [Thermodesulfobium narugense]AEE14292.1 Ribosomal RNA small subunit methyltransferase H [Thermodesulfobium narugense DSM 14796]
MSNYSKDIHIPVLLNEVLENSNLAPGKVVVDGTIGAGGHSFNFLKKILPGGFLLGFDKDIEAVKLAVEKLSSTFDRNSFTIFNDKFENFVKYLNFLPYGKFDLFFLDLGLSTMQIKESNRGFSFMKDEKLDMRMDLKEKMTASDWLNSASEEEMEEVFRKYGEEPKSRKLAKMISLRRREKPFESTMDLAQLVKKIYPYGRRHPATRIFQAIRIVINDEIEHLEATLREATNHINSLGRIIVISFHSGEDRVVKWTFKNLEKEGRGRVITKKPIIASESETKENPSARSAKMRVWEAI